MPLQFFKIVLIAFVGCSQLSLAQEADTIDRPSQRSLQLPNGELPDIGEQARLLQQLRDMVSPKPMPPVSEQQLQQMEQTFRRWQSEFGDDLNLKDLNSIPMEWIEQAIANPQARQQAERLLEQYVRNRQHSPNPEKADAAGQNARSASNDQLGEAPVTGSAASPQPRKLTDAGKIKSLQELFKKLTEAESARNLTTKNSQPRSSDPSNSSSRARSQASASNPSRNPALDANNQRRSNTRNLSANGRLPAGAQPQTNSANDFDDNSVTRDLTNTDLSEYSGEGTRGENESVPQNELFDPATPDFSIPPRNESSKNKTENAAGKSLAPNAANPSRSSAAENSRRRNANQPALHPDPSTSPSEGNANQKTQSEPADVKSQIDRYGLGGTLRRMFEKTMAEQQSIKSDRAVPQPYLQPSDGKQAAVPAANPPSPSSAPPLKRSSPPSVVDGGSDPTLGSKLRALAMDVWQSISTVSQVRAKPPSSNESNEAAESPSNITFSLNGNGWLVILLVVLVVIFLIRIGRRRQHASATNAIEAGWAKEILRAGVRTRADIIRAFHHFVLQRPQPVSNWWNHRYVAQQLSEASPHLSPSIQELTSLYEFARYQPPELELSSEQLQRAHAALQKCNA